MRYRSINYFVSINNSKSLVFRDFFQNYLSDIVVFIYYITGVHISDELKKAKERRHFERNPSIPEEINQLVMDLAGL